MKDWKAVLLLQAALVTLSAIFDWHWVLKNITGTLVLTLIYGTWKIHVSEVDRRYDYDLISVIGFTTPFATTELVAIGFFFGLKVIAIVVVTTVICVCCFIAMILFACCMDTATPYPGELT
jgi:hypothetical protein